MATKYSDAQIEEALAIAENSTIREASEQTGVATGTIKWYRAQRGQKKARKKNPTNQPKAQTIAKANQPTKKEQVTVVGRPSKYQEEYVTQAFKLCLLGATDKDLANFFETSEQTINAWKKNYPKFLEALKRGKSEADSEVAQKLFHRALGYEHKEDKIFNHNGKPLVVPTIKHYAPDTTAAIFWLKNRQPYKWRDKPEDLYELTLIQEFIEIFLAEFEQENKSAFDAALQRITENPRMVQLVEEQRRRKGEE